MRNRLCTLGAQGKHDPDAVECGLHAVAAEAAAAASQGARILERLTTARSPNRVSCSQALAINATAETASKAEQAPGGGGEQHQHVDGKSAGNQDHGRCGAPQRTAQLRTECM